MKKKIANAIELILLLVSFIILNIKNMTIIGNSVWSEPYKVSAIDCMEKYTLAIVPMCAFYILCAIMCIVSIISKNQEKDGKIHGVLAIILFFTVNWNLITCTSGDNIIENDFPGAIFELVLFLVIVIAFAKRSPIIVGKQKDLQQTVINNMQEVSSADELKKYKELLDSGVITQEEFDEKKKQLLNL